MAGALLACLLLGGSAEAQWELTGFLGASITPPSDVHVRLAGRDTSLRFSEVDWRTESFESPLYYGVRVGYWLRSRPWLGLGAELIHAKVRANPGQEVAVSGSLQGAALHRIERLGEIVQNLSISHGMNYLFATVALRRRFRSTPQAPEGRWDLVLRGGFGPTLPHAETTILNRTRGEYQYGGLAAQVGAGVVWWARPHFGWSGEYKLSYSPVDFDTAEGAARTTLVSHHFITGLGWRW